MQIGLCPVILLPSLRGEEFFYLLKRVRNMIIKLLSSFYLILLLYPLLQMRTHYHPPDR